eukprot:gene54059-51931_t
MLLLSGCQHASPTPPTHHTHRHTPICGQRQRVDDGNARVPRAAGVASGARDGVARVRNWDDPTGIPASPPGGYAVVFGMESLLLYPDPAGKLRARDR